MNETSVMQSSWLIPGFALMTAAFLWPVEDAVNGGGLCLVVLWLMLSAAYALRAFRTSGQTHDFASASVPFGWTDVGILLIVSGHLVSTMVVFQVGGDRRAAVNLSMEWVGLFAAWRFFRHVCKDRFNASQVVSVVTTVAVGLAVYGIWQHHVFYPQQANWYRDLRLDLDNALSQSHGPDPLRVAELSAQFESLGIPTEGAEKILWENRLLASSEPFATFSLANTLAGVLATALILLWGQTLSEGQGGKGPGALSRIVSLLSFCALGYCLLLTKSRSAWAGVATGAGVLVLLHSQTPVAKTVTRWLPVGFGIFSIVLAAAITVGALDKEVLLESPRSLQFRLLYWHGTLQMMKDHPLAGVGPGNFRQVYLRYKAPESSEEIRDPHNFVLESWTAGGLIGLIGLLLIILCTFRQLFFQAPQREGELQNSPLPAVSRNRKTVIVGMLLGFLLHFLWEWLNGQSMSENFHIVLLLMSGAGLTIFQPGHRFRPIDRIASLAAAVTLMTNLLAAGGFEMPSLMLLLLVCIASGSTPAGEVSSGLFRFRRLRRTMCGGIALTSAFAGIVVLKYGLIPVTGADRALQLSKDLMQRQRIIHASLEAAQAAADRDPLGVAGRQQIAELETFKLSQLEAAVLHEQTSQQLIQFGPDNQRNSAERMKAALSQAMDACEKLIAADRRSNLGYRIRAACLAAGARVLKDPQMLADAITSQQTVVAMNPSSAHDWLELAKLCQSAPVSGNPQLAQSAASRALELEGINRNWGHQDQFLRTQDLELLTKLVEH